MDAKHTYKWPAQAGDRLDRDFTPDDLRPELEACGIDGTVLIQVLRDQETREFSRSRARQAFVRGVVGWVAARRAGRGRREALEEFPNGAGSSASAT